MGERKKPVPEPEPPLEAIEMRDRFQYERMGGPDLQCQADRHALLKMLKEALEEVERQKEMVWEASMGEDI